MDFYTSPIVLEVNRVDIRLRVTSADDSKNKATEAGKTADDPNLVPHTIDLAASFLETQPLEEKKKLEDALAADSHDMGASVALSDSSTSEDDESAFGTGQPLSLPAFLADFLQGVVDRTQVRIRGVTFQLGIDVPLDSNSTATELVTFQVALDRIDVEGVTAEVRDEEGEPLIRPKEGKRHIALSQIRACLISEANVFSSFARSPSVSSPAMSRVASFTEREDSSQAEPERYQHGLHQSELIDSVDLTEVDDALLRDSEDALEIPYELTEGSGPEEGETNTTPRASVYQESPESPSVFDANSHLFHDFEDDYEDDKIAPWAVPSKSQSSCGPAAESHLTQSAEHGLRSSDGPHRLTEGLQGLQGQTDDRRSRGMDASSSLHSSHDSLPRTDSPDGREAAELAESQVFTHEDAESMYLSAFSQAGSQQLRSDMPGTWNNSPEPSPRKSTIGNLEKKPSHSNFSSDRIPSPSQEEQALAQEQRSEELGVLEPSAHGISEPAPDSENAMEASPEVTKTLLRDEPMTPTQEDPSTPRGPTRLVKEIVTLDRISLYIPSKHQHLHIQSGELSSSSYHSGNSRRLVNSVAPQIPGAFSVHSTTPGIDESQVPRLPSHSVDKDVDDKSLEVIISPLEVRFDASLAFLLATVLGKLFDAFKDVREPSQKTKSSSPEQPKEPNTSSAIKVTIDKITVLFLNQLGGVTDTAERVLKPPSLHLQPEILLRTILDNLTISVQSMNGIVETTIDLEKFKFGYAKDDIISFDQSLQMRASVMDKLPSAGADVSVKVIKTPDSMRSEITTLPLLVQLDLQRLDETLSWFGGLSSFLNLSSSVTSSTSITAKPPIQSSRKLRGVRFDTPINPDDKSAQSQNKLDMRVGGFNLELRGRDCLVALETSAVKMVSRDSGIGFAISKARLAGPYVRNSKAGPPITADVAGLRFDYLNTPTEQDLERLLQLITPSRIKTDEADEEIMVDTLIGQRRKGPILRVNVEQLQVRVGQMSQLVYLPGLGEELARLGTVAKYLPQDDRPGLLTLTRVLDARASLDFGGTIGTINGHLRDLEVAQISIPSLIALVVGSIAVDRNHREDLVSSPSESTLSKSSGPVLMVRMIGDEMEPAIKVRMWDVTIDYRVPTIMDVLGLGPQATPQDYEASLAASVANLGDQAHTALQNKQPSRPMSSDSNRTNSKPTKVNVLFKNCLLGLNPLKHASKLVIALNDAQLEVVLPNDTELVATLHLNKAELLLTDDASRAAGIDPSRTRRQQPAPSGPIADLISRGFVRICSISAAKVVLNLAPNSEDGEKQVNIDMRDDLLILETCADSTQTLIALANGLAPPTPPSKEIKYRTKVNPMHDLFESISPEAFGQAEGAYDFDEDFPMAHGTGSDDEYDIMLDSHAILEEAQQGYGQREDVAGTLFSAGGSMMSGASDISDQEDAVHFEAGNPEDSDGSSNLAFESVHFGTSKAPQLKCRTWNSLRNSYGTPSDDVVRRSPVRISVRDVHVIWRLFDGYDWTRTRDEITKAVEEVEQKATQTRKKREATNFDEDEDEDGEMISDYLFNSIYIGIPANRDPRELAQMVNEEINDGATFTETESIATTATVTPVRSGSSGAAKPKKKLRLDRSRSPKIIFELSGVNADLIVYPPGSGETQNFIDVRIHNLDIFDHIPTSTWKMFATYDKDAGTRAVSTSMVHLEVINVKPQEDLAASELVLKVTVLPLRLHVDQDALEFITRFFEFKDDSVAVHASPSDVPFLQRVEVMTIPVQLDFKPKRVDYAGLRSGRTTEFMNFVILDQAHLKLRHAIIYGISGFDKMGKTLNDLWMPDVKNNQLPTVLAGLAPIRGLVNIGSGIRDLVEIPIREYQKDGRIFRSLRLGATAFARTTGTEVVKLGAKVAIGTQTALQGAEGLLTAKPTGTHYTPWDGDDTGDVEEQNRQISLYADQPSGVAQGIKGGYASLARDLHVARDALIAVQGEARQSQNAAGMAKAVMQRAPTIVFRPVIGASKAISKTLMGATNSLDPENRRRVEEASTTLLPSSSNGY